MSTSQPPETVLRSQSSGSESESQSPFLPLKRPLFRMLWCVWLTANISMWMNDVASAWMMTSINASPLWVALVQTASTLPMFLLGLPSGAFADIFDRRRYFLVTQFWVAAIAVVLAATVLSDLMTPWLLLALTFANGIGLAMRWPVFSAVVPDLVPRPELPAALALNGIAMNASRVGGPLIAGALIAGAGSAYVFLLNALASVICGFVIFHWRYERAASTLERERLFRAMRVGIQFVGRSALLKAVLLKASLFVFHSTALLALLPLVARGLRNGGAGTFTVLLGAMGSGAIVAALFLPRLRRSASRDALILRGAALQSLSTLVVAFSPNVYVAVVAMFLAGTAWITTANSLSVSAQLGLPDWVRARGMSIFQMAITGAGAAGAAVWGQIATLLTVQISLAIAAACGTVAMIVANRFVVDRTIEEDLTPSRALKAPVLELSSQSGKVVVTIEYLIDPKHMSEFRQVMLESRRSCLQQGALRWDLLDDITQPGRYVEQIVDASWTEHLRRFDRVTASDVLLQERKLAFHTSVNTPLVNRYQIIDS